MMVIEQNVSEDLDIMILSLSGDSVIFSFIVESFSYSSRVFLGLGFFQCTKIS